MRPSFAVRRAGGYANSPQPRRADPASLQDLAGRSMGTTWSLRLHNPAMLPLDAVRTAVQDALDRVVAQMSTWEADSDISRFNRADAGSRHLLAPEFAEVIACAVHWAEASGGAIDPSVGPLVALWGFGAHAAGSAAPEPPSHSALTLARQRVGWQRLAFDPAQGSLLQPGGGVLDLSGIAKGFGVDQAAQALQSLGIRDFLVEVGGELRAAGRRPDGARWQVQVEALPGCSQRIALDDMAIATSGDRWHAHEHQGRRWSHTLDPRSGEPTPRALASVSVLHRECMQADALATVLSVLGPQEGLAFARRHGIAALFVCRADAGPACYASEGWPTLCADVR
ncbi:FAD:protein FMN transferase [Variovorax sp. J22P168]|uniref:FAD:protein FMN transferase n=1 Tax=Variovorax jilinensis TaxID=3053513 RepID=UPI002575F716|nr:FAD:protein FMN transferase [Variovorax sp. J22P168]MDM0013786.1 FAD:protein FMN transferase [Variovorax sp. J22P168]